MSAVIREIEAKDGHREFGFHCPGCGYGHWVRVAGPRPCWTWNGDMEKPTFHPSLNVGPGTKLQCHSFITDGKIRFLNDCHHKLAGKTVPLPEI